MGEQMQIHGIYSLIQFYYNVNNKHVQIDPLALIFDFCHKPVLAACLMHNPSFYYLQPNRSALDSEVTFRVLPLPSI